MRIDEIKINAYGNIKDKEINLKDGINIIHGENESGKSTLLSYISNAFYGISKNKEGKNVSDYDKYKPWEGTEFSGRVGYTLEDGRKYEVFRDFSKKNPKIYNEKMEDISSNFDIDKKEGSKFFTEQTGMDKQMYLSTIVSMQQEVRLDEKNQNILVQKIANLAGTGDDNVSYKKAVTKLQDKIRDEIGTSKTSQKPINIVKNRLYKISEELERIKPYQEKKYVIDNERKSLINKVEKTEVEEEIAKKLKEYAEENNLTENVLKINMASINDSTKNITNLKEQISVDTRQSEILNDEYKKVCKEKELKIKEVEECSIKENELKTLEEKSYTIKPIKYIIIAALLIMAIIIDIALLNTIVISVGAVLAFIVNIVLYVVKGKKNKEIEENNKRKRELLETTILKKQNATEEIKNIEIKIMEIEGKQNEINNAISMAKGKVELLEKNKEQLEKEIKEKKHFVENELNNQKELLKQEYSEKLSEEEIQEILQTENIGFLISEIQEELTSHRLKLKSIELEEKNIMPQLDNIVNLKEEQQKLKEEEEELKNKEDIINIAMQCLTEAYEEMKTTITPKFTKNLSNSISKISNGKYSKVTINDESGMIIENMKGEYIEADKLSVGTIDQLYLSLRLSMINDISKENMPIMLDETFAYFDNARLENILKYLSEELKDHQSIIFTCTDREKEILNKLDIEYNLIEL